MQTGTFVAGMAEQCLLLNGDTSFYDPVVERNGMRILIGVVIFLAVLIALAALRMSSVSAEGDEQEYEIDPAEDDALPDKDRTKER